MRQLIIQDLEVYAYHGVYDFEKEQGQPYLIQCRIGITDEGDIQDDLAETISYVDCLDVIREAFLGEKYNLLEYVAQVITHKLFKLDSRIVEVDLTILKTKPPVDDTIGALGVRLCRSSI